MTNIGSQNNMLFMLASLACGQKESTAMVPHRIPLSDTSDDETTLATSQAKEIVVARRRRRPIKKRRSSSLMLLGSSIRPRSMPETSMDDSNNPILRLKIQAHKDSIHEIPEVQRSVSVPQTVDEEMPSLISDDAGWKKIHAPLELPCFLPCPAVALKNVKSINLTIQER